MEFNIYNEDCFETMRKMEANSVGVILTSPPYNTGRAYTSEKARDNYEGRYDVHVDNMTQEEYLNWSVRLFNSFDKVLKKDGVVLYNISYGSDATVNTESIGLMWLVVAEIIKKTPFTVADRIIWKKSSALPNNVSKNKLTRIVENVFVFVRKDEIRTFNANKKVASVRDDGQKVYENVFNFVIARNNDGPCPLNKATYSSELCEKLLEIYASEKTLVYDPFTGSGTTGVACKSLDLDFIGSEISKDQVDYAINRIENGKNNVDGQLSFDLLL